MPVPIAMHTALAPAPLPSSTGLRVVYLNYEWDLRESTGAATHVRELAGALRELGHTVAVFDRHRMPEGDSPSPSSNGTVPVRHGDSPVRRLRTRLSPWLHEWAAVARAAAGVRAERAILRAVRPDVVLTRHSLHQFSSLIAARRLGLPIVFEVNAPLAFEYRRFQPHYRLVPRFAEWTETRTLAAADGVFVVSSVLKEHLVGQGVPAERIAVVPNGADPQRFTPEAADRSLRAVHGNAVLVGFVGSFANFHGVQMLRHAIAEVLPRRDDVVFVLVGHGPLAAELQAFCTAAGFGDRVLLTGFVPPERVPGLMAAMDVLLAPYAAREPFYFSSLKLFEYMACGRAVLAPRLGQIAEVIEDGRNGLLYAADSPSAFVAQLLALVANRRLRVQLGWGARHTVRTQYTWRANAERVTAVLEQARARHAGRTR